MRKNSVFIGFCLALAVGGCGAAAQTQTSSRLAGVQCASLSDVDRQVAQILAPENVERVEPVYRTEFLARAIHNRYVVGADLHVPAQAGMSQGYVERVLTCHAAAHADGQSSDPLTVANLRDVDVTPHGQRLVIRIEGSDRASGKAVWERARALHERSTNVEVRQLSAAPRSAQNL